MAAVRALYENEPCAPGRARRVAEDILAFGRQASAMIPSEDWSDLPTSLRPTEAAIPKFITGDRW